MKNRKQMLALLLSLALVVSLCACDPADGDASADPSASPTIEVDLSQNIVAFSAGLSPTDVPLTVNGKDVSIGLFLYVLYDNCNSLLYQYYSMYWSLPSSLEPYAQMLREDTADVLTYHTVIRQKAAELGCILTDEQRAEVDALKTGEKLEYYEQYKAVYSLTDEDMDFIACLNHYYNNVLEAVTHEPNEQELKDYLDGQGVFRVKHILLKTTDSQNQPLGEDEIKAKKALADDLLAQLQAAEDMPAKFDELMNEYSDDGGLADYPDGYIFDSSDSLVGGFREAALELEEGQLSGIVETDYGYHIMLRLALPDETVDSYRRYIRQSDLNDQMEKWMEAAEITRDDALLDGIDVQAFFDLYYAYFTAAQEQNGDAAD